MPLLLKIFIACGVRGIVRQSLSRSMIYLASILGTPSRCQLICKIGFLMMSNARLMSQEDPWISVLLSSASSRAFMTCIVADSHPLPRRNPYCPGERTSCSSQTSTIQPTIIPIHILRVVSIFFQKIHISYQKITPKKYK